MAKKAKPKPFKGDRLWAAVYADTGELAYTLDGKPAMNIHKQYLQGCTAVCGDVRIIRVRVVPDEEPKP